MNQLSKPPPLTYFDPVKIHFHPASEQLVQNLMLHCDNNDPSFFRAVVTYYICKAASKMRCSITTAEFKKLPVNAYVIALAPSGAGKGKSNNFLEEEVFGQFDERFLNEVLPAVAEENLAKLATERADRSGESYDDEYSNIMREFRACGAWVDKFNGSTSAALYQYRNKLLMANAGSLNLEVDEVGDNFTSLAEILSRYLELYDKGKISANITKNTAENVRNSPLKGNTPANCLLFGTPSTVNDGGATEDAFYNSIESGMGRRSFFAYSHHVYRDTLLTADELLDKINTTTRSPFIDDFAQSLYLMADPLHYDKSITMSTDVTLIWLEYKLWTVRNGEKLGKYRPHEKGELEHRYFKTLKLAAAYAFIDNHFEITENHLYNAIALTEASGKDFQRLINRETNYVKLCNFLGETHTRVTQVELAEKLPFYKGSKAAKTEMLEYAIAHGYLNNVIIKKSFESGIMFLEGESLEATSLERLIVAYSTDIADGYYSDQITFDNLAALSQMPNMHWINHRVDETQHRSDEHIESGFNLIVIDVDNDTPNVVALEQAKELMKDYQCIFYTTKRHGVNSKDRFRIILPLKYVLHLDKDDYAEFMKSVFSWLPFDSDTVTGQRSRKWLSHQHEVHTNEGLLFDPISFIPRTSKNEERQKQLLDTASLSNLERWFVEHTGEGNRSNQLIKYALMLVDGGQSLNDVEDAVNRVNDQIQNPLSKQEIKSTIMVTAAKRVP